MMDFDGVGDCVNIDVAGAVDSFNGVTAGTLMCWAITDTDEDTPPIGFSINNGGTPSNTFRFAIDRNGSFKWVSRSRAGDGDSQQTITDPGAVPTIGTQYHVEASVNIPGDTGKIHVDGALVVTGAPTYAGAAFDATASASAAIAANPNTSAPDDEYNGRLEDCRAYQRQLSDAEVQTIHACRGHDGIWFDIHNRWRLNDNAPTVVAAGAGVVKDIAQFQGHGAAVGAPTWQETRLSFRRRYL